MFSDEEFYDACKELDSPNLENWDFFAQSESKEIQIYRQYISESGLYAYKIFGTMDIKPEICAQVYLDLDYRKVWDPYLKQYDRVSNGETTGIYWLLNFPFPLSKRDLVYAREDRQLDIEGLHIWVILSKVDESLSKLVNINKNVVRIKHCTQTMAIAKHGENGSKAFSFYYDDPGGMLPAWFINWAAKTGVPAFLDKMIKACHEYEAYLKNKTSTQNLPKKKSEGDLIQKRRYFPL